MKAAIQATVLVAAVGGAIFAVRARHHEAPAARPPATDEAAIARATARAAAARAVVTSPPAAASLVKRLDHDARLEMLRRLDEARQQSWRARPAATATNDEPIDKDYIREQIQVLLPQLSECYTNALHRDPRLERKMMVDFSIVGDPSVGGLVGESKVNAAESTIADAEMRECVQETMYAAQFVPPKAGGEVRVSYPFVFKPGEE